MGFGGLVVWVYIDWLFFNRYIIVDKYFLIDCGSSVDKGDFRMIEIRV